jgi:hypothetical protein
MGLGALLAGVNAVAAKQKFRAPVTSLGLSALAQADWEQTADAAARAATVDTGAADARISAMVKEQARRDGARADAEQTEHRDRLDAEDRTAAVQAIAGRYREEELGMSADEAPASGGGFLRGLGKLGKVIGINQ